ncbi:MAG: 3-carboxy-cis,cis-muconate cycloisomerase [Saprospiraceae bacterium]|nr:3-carboxy-cis,cis-muconate cycloisomerase [Saprospiraceae bacterium]
MLYESLFYDKDINALFTDEAIVAGLLQFEAALAEAQAQHGLIPETAAQAIVAACVVENIDFDTLKTAVGLGGNVNIPLVKQLTAAVKRIDTEGAKFVHLGATSQDVIDTATVLQAQKAVLIILKNTEQLIAQLAQLADTHKESLMIGRSFMQQARPITFGFKVATWLDGILRSKQRLERLLHNNFQLQLGGAVGTLASMPEKGLAVAETMARILNLSTPSVSWHTQRDNLVEIATTLGILSGSISKIAQDISLLMQTEIGEVFEPATAGKGGSSTMPHKRNPVGCTAILANARRIPPLVSTLLACMTQDHERATGAWHAEWETLTDIFKLTAGSLRQAIEITNGLEVDKDRMLKNIDVTEGLIFAENVSLALAEKIGKTEAHELVEQACKITTQTHTHLKNVLSDNETVKKYLNPEELDTLFDPKRAIGFSVFFVEQKIR